MAIGGWQSRTAAFALAATLLGCGSVQYAASVAPQAPAAPPVALTSEADHQRMMSLLHIPSLRPGVNGSDPAAANAANYDEAKANPDTNLPDPLTFKKGGKVTSARGWERRRAEIVEDFDREVYGRVPAETPSVRWDVVSTQTETGGATPTVTKQLVGHVDNSSYPPVRVAIEMKLVVPANAAGPVPVIMEFGFEPPPGVKLPEQTGTTWQQQVLALGWGYAVLMPKTVQPDDGAGLTAGIIGLVNKGQPRKPEDWGALRAWAWGASRALDYLETEKSVNAKEVGIEGLSRYGKAALVTMAYDERFAIAFVGSSGEGGAKLSRRNYGELVENVASTSEYHWMAGNFLKYAGPLAAKDLPVDAHELIALCAPRPVFIGSGSKGDSWADPRGMFLAEVAAGPVYRLLGKKDLGSAEMPPIGTALASGDLAFRQHELGHTSGPNWPAFLAFAQRYLGVAPAPKK